MAETVKIKGELEVDTERGVIYFHSNETGTTVLRISALPTPIPDPRENAASMDIAFAGILPTDDAARCNWKGDGR